MDMFRQILKKKNEIDENEIDKLLNSCRRGVLAVNGDDGYPYCLPINYLYVKEENKIYFHSSKIGHKVDSLEKSDKVSFTICGKEEYHESTWAPYVKSVIVFGRCHKVNEDKLLEVLKRFALKYYPSEPLVDEEINRSIKAVRMYQIDIEHLSGKRVQEK